MSQQRQRAALGAAGVKKPRALPKSSSLAPSALRPLAHPADRFRAWSSQYGILRDVSNASILAADARRRRFDAIFSSVEESTRITYGAGLLRFHEFCDAQSVPESERVPASDFLLSAFVAHYLGSIGSSTVNNWIAGLQLWHNLQDAPWRGARGLAAAMKGVAKHTPQTSKREPRPPVTRAHIACLRENLDLSGTMDSAVYAVAVTAFRGCCRLGELVVPSAGAFDAARHVAQGAFTVGHAANAVPFGRLHLPFSKTTGTKGADVFLTETGDDLCAVRGIQHHLAINDGAPDNMPFFSWKAADGQWYPLTKTWFLQRCAAIWDAHGLTAVYGHSFRIGGTTDLLLRGIPPGVVAVQGRWSSRAFMKYWRRVEDILPVFLSRSQATVSVESVAKAVARFESELV